MWQLLWFLLYTPCRELFCERVIVIVIVIVTVASLLQTAYPDLTIAKHGLGVRAASLMR